MTRILVVGGGRMGRAILERALEDDAVSLLGVVLRRSPDDALPGNPPVFLDLPLALDSAPNAVVLDFSSAENAGLRVRSVAERGHALVLGTTGLDAAAVEAVNLHAARVAIVVAPNTSPGVLLLRRAIHAVMPAVSLGWDTGIVDRHHRAKKDAPSGTAKLLAEDLRKAGAERVEIVSLRQGGVVGEHAIHFAGGDEEIVLLHRATSRKAFASGALLAARFAATARPGRYGMEDVLDQLAV